MLFNIYQYVCAKYFANLKKSWILLEERTINGGRNKESFQDVEVEKKHKT